MKHKSESVLMSVGQPATACLNTLTGRRKRSLETVLIQSNCQEFYQCEDENMSTLHRGGATKKILRESVVRSNKNRKVLSSKSNSHLDSMCSIFHTATSDVNMSQSLEREKKQSRSRQRQRASTDKNTRNEQNKYKTKREGNAVKTKLRHYRKDRTLANIENVDIGKRRKSARINKGGQEKIISLNVTCHVTSRNPPLEQEKKKEQRNRRNKMKDEHNKKKTSNSMVYSIKSSNAKEQWEEQLQIVDACQEITHHDPTLTCKENIPPRRSQRTPKPITNRLTVNWENVKSYHHECITEQAKKVTLLSLTKRCASDKTLIRHQRKLDTRIPDTSTRKSSRKIKGVEQLVITWDNNKRYHSRSYTEYDTRKTSIPGPFPRDCAPSDHPTQLLLNENVVKNLDTTRFQEADRETLLNTTLVEQPNIVTLDTTTLGAEQRQNVGETEEELNLVPELNVTKEIQPIPQRALRRSLRKPQPTARFTVTWTDQCAVTDTKVASTHCISTTPDKNHLHHGYTIASSKVSFTSPCDGNYAPCSDPKDITSQSQSSPTIVEIEAFSQDKWKSEEKALNASTKQNSIEIRESLNLSISSHIKNKELLNKAGSLLVTSPRIQNVNDMRSTRKSCRKAQPIDRFTITWSKGERAPKLVSNTAPATKTAIDHPHSSNSPDVIHLEGTEVSRNNPSTRLSIHQRDTGTAARGILDKDDNWNFEEISLLWRTVMAGSDPTASNFWNSVAQKIKTKDAAECHKKWFSMDRTFGRKDGSRAKKTDTGREKNFLARSNHVKIQDVNDIFNATPMLGRSLINQRLPAHIVLPQLEDFNSPIIRSPAIAWNKYNGNVLYSPLASCQKFISRRSPILDKKGYKGYLKSLSRQGRIFSEKRKKKSTSQADTVQFTVKKKKTLNMPLRATFADGNIEMTATLHDGNLELRGPSDSDLEDLGIDLKSFDDECEMECSS